jgi:ABC-type branched-subunit amino acid transport system ATPase component
MAYVMRLTPASEEHSKRFWSFLQLIKNLWLRFPCLNEIRNQRDETLGGVEQQQILASERVLMAKPKPLMDELSLILSKKM